MQGIVRNLIAQHLRYALRALHRHPVTSALAVGILACGIGLTASIYSFVDGILLRDLPFPEADRLVFLDTRLADSRRILTGTFQRDFARWREEQGSFDPLVAAEHREVNLSDDAAFPDRVAGAFIGHEMFRAVAVEPRLGRGFTAAEDRPGAAAVAVLGFELWQQRYRGDPGVLGKSVRVDGESAEIVGVMPPGFRFPERQEIWLPLRLDPERHERGEGPRLRVFGRLADGVSRRAAQVEMTRIVDQIAREHPQTNTGRGVKVAAYTAAHVAPTYAGQFWNLLWGAGSALLIAGANVASLLLARTTRRERELALYTALGARRWHVMGYVMSESLVMALLGALGGLGLAAIGVRTLAAEVAWLDLPFWMEVSFDLRVVALIAGLTVAVAHLSGLVPAWQATRAEVGSLLGESRGAGSRRIGRFLRLLLVVQMAVAFALLVPSLLLVRSLVNLQRLDLGVDPDRMLTARTALPELDYPELADRAAFVERWLESLRAQPGVAGVAATTSLPAAGWGNRMRFAVDGRAYATRVEQPQAHRVAVSPGFLELFRIPVLQGRGLTADDRSGAPPTVVVNRSLATRTWPDADPIGRRLQLTEEPGRPWRTVVGLVPDAFAGLLLDADPAGLYVPLAQTGDRDLAVAVLAHGEPGELAEVIRRQAQALDPGLPVFKIRTLRQVIEAEKFDPQFLGAMISSLGLVAVLLAAAGVVGVNLFAVGLRTTELGVRRALGATRGAVVWLILRESLGRSALGVLLGLPLAIYFTRSMAQRLLFEVRSDDPWTFVSAALALGAVAFLASLVPAWRAARVDPVVALRHD